MGSGISLLENAYHYLFIGSLIILAVLVVLCLLRAIIGPKVADRIVAANMMGTMVMVIISILAIFLGEGYLVDICIIYAMISFLAVIVLTKVYTGVYLESKKKSKNIDIDDIDVFENENDILLNEIKEENEMKEKEEA